jgi:hypothetical protein
VLVMAKMLLSLMDMFDVPKGENDIRLVYNGSKSGLNESLWAPWFCLPTVDTMCRTLFPNSWCGDNDYGEIFLNFKMHRDLQKYSGIESSEGAFIWVGSNSVVTDT